ncbi:hypothetical protein V6N11_018468 [Hibiscus sabdariffa]|uniref:Reverse transcriptase zinc-binding domain-containing protein n=1 Tax=Hibiscus sabdariffa TaxID=183260 RepID=A0ABR2T7G4_9ROSI
MPHMRGKAYIRPYRNSGAFSSFRLALARPTISGVAMTQSLPTLPKVRIFSWRLGHDCLPTGSRVATAGLGLGLCPFCPTTVETSLHAFRDCPDASEALHLCGFPSLVTASLTTSILDWLVEAARSLSREDFAKLLLVLWNLWNRQNLWADSFLSYLATPPSGVVAISVDGAFIQSHGADIGVVARDSNGRVLGGLA